MFKKILTLAITSLLPATYCTAKPVIKNNRFKVVFNKEFTPEMAENVSRTGQLPGKAHTFQFPDNALYNLKNLKKDYTPIKDQAIVYCEIDAPQACDITIGLAADYWYTCYVNGKLTGTTEPGGELIPDLNDLSPYCRTWRAELKKGINRVALHTRPGNASWRIAFKLLPTLQDWPERKFDRDRFYSQLNEQLTPQGVLGPFPMQISTDSAAIALKLNYPEAVFMQYNIRGQKPYMRKHNARYGRLPRTEIHRFELNNLQADTEYEYRIISADQFDKVLTQGSFRTLPATGIKQSFIAFSDTQTVFREREKVVRKMAANDDFKKADMFVSLGDVTSTFDDFHRSYFDSFLLPINEVSPGKLFYPVRGNHEFRGMETDFYGDWFGAPYYAFRNGDVFYIVLDSGEDKPRAKKSAYTWRTYHKEYFQEQKAWLEKVVESEACKSAKRRIVLVHTTPFEWEKPYYAQNLNFMCGDIFYGENPRCKLDLWVCGDIHSPYRFDPVTGIMAGSKRPATAKRRCELTANDRKNLRFPIIVNDGPRGAGVDFTSILVEIDGESMIVTTRDWENNLMDKVQITPGKPFKILETTYENYQPYQAE